MQWDSLALWAVLAVGSCLVIAAWFLAAGTPSSAARSGVLAGVGSSLLTGLVVALVLGQYQEEATWRSGVASADAIPGFTAQDHDLRGLVFNGKNLRSAELAGADLRGLKFRDAMLPGANLRNARLDEAELTGADLSTANLEGADLSGARLLGTDFSEADIEQARSLAGAKVNANTTWPCGFLTSPLLAQVEATAVHLDGQMVTSRGNEYCAE
jgi:hypothetical protein